MQYFQKDMPTKFETDPEPVFALAYSVKINQKKMKRLEKEYTTMKTKEKEDEIELRRLRTENRLLRQRVDLLEQESSNLADRLIQGQVTRAEVEEHTFAIKRELAAVKQHDLDTNQQLEEAKERILKLSQIVDSQHATAVAAVAASSSSPDSPPAVAVSAAEEELRLKSEVIRQKEEMIHCLQDELIKERLGKAENEEKIRNLTQKVSDLEQETKRLRESVPENDVATMQEELAAAKLREAEANLALKELRAKVSELSAMWQKHVKRNGAGGGGDNEDDSTSTNATPNGSVAAAIAPSTPKKLLGQLLPDTGLRQQLQQKLEEDLMTARVAEVDSQAELKEQRLKVMELETQV